MKRILTVLIIVASSFPSAYALVKVGGGELFVDLAGRIEHSSNVFSNNKEVEDFLWKFTPGLSFERRKGVISLNASLDTTAVRYFEETLQNTENHTAYVKISRPREGDYPLSYNVGVNYNISSAANEEVGTILRSRNLKLFADGEYDLFGKMAAGLDLELSRTNFMKSSAADTSEKMVEVTGIYRYSPKLNFIAGDAYTIYNARGAESPDGESHAFFIGANDELSPKITGMVCAGIIMRKFENSVFKDTSNPYYSVDVAWEISEKTRVTAKLSRKFSVTAALASKFTDSIKMDISHQFSTKFKLGAEIGMDLAEHKGAPNTQRDHDDSTKFIGLFYSYKLTDGIKIAGMRVMNGITLSGKFRYTQKKSNSDAHTFNDPNLGIGVSYQY